MGDGVFWPELRAWLEEHGIPVDDCYQVVVAWNPASVHGGENWEGPVRMQVTRYRLDGQGRRYLTADGEPASETRMVPMRRMPAVEVVRYRSQEQAGDA
jgi:hypothetical protein